MPEQEEGNLKRNLGISRRDLLRRGAIVGGTVIWATPVIQSIGGKAMAFHNRYNACCECNGQTGCQENHITEEECEFGCSGQPNSFGTGGVKFYSEWNFGCSGPQENQCVPQGNNQV